MELWHPGGLGGWPWSLVLFHPDYTVGSRIAPDPAPGLDEPQKMRLSQGLGTGVVCGKVEDAGSADF
jgi:hypothetical protein